MSTRRAAAGKPVIPRTAALRDIDDAIDFYLTAEEGADHAALGFVDALEQAYAHIARHPATGSPRFAHELNLPGLRVWALKRYPYLVFCVGREDCIDVWRMLQERRDVAEWLE